jgi:aspartyl-tRNA(Asn)/glutamyl-tRNA(Gln) amidotransferase subunit B
LKDADIEIYTREAKWGRLLEECAEILGSDKKLIQLASNYITSNLKTPIPAEALSEVIRMITDGEISSRGAKDIFKIIEEVGGEPRSIAEEKKLIQISDKEVLEKIATEVLGENENAPIQFLVGQAMKKSEGRANPQMLQKIIEEALS